MTQNSADKSLIKKYLRGEATKEEIIRVNLYMQQPGAQELFDAAWEETDPDMLEPAFREDTIFFKSRDWRTKINTRINAAQRPGRFSIKPFYRLAAACAVIVMLGLGTYMNFGHFSAPQMILASNPKGKNILITLPDNSKIWLGAGSSLQYPGQFKGKTRELTLVGEAFFDVTKNPEKPFIIHTGNVETTVLGTSFKIQAYPGQSHNVAVSTGKVRVGRENEGEVKELAVLTPGKQLTWNDAKRQAVKQSVQVTDVLQWKYGKQAFKDVSLGDICKTLVRWYDVKIDIIDRDLVNMQLYTTLDNNKPLTETMAVLSATGNFSYQIDKGKITISKMKAM